MGLENLEDIIEQCKLNDRASQEMLYRHYFPFLFRSVKKLIHDESDILTIINDGFLKVFKYIHSYKPDLGLFDSWLHRIVVNTAYDHLKKSKARNIEYADISIKNERPDNSYLAITDASDIESMLIKLPATTGKVLTMSIDGYSHKEIAIHLGISEISSRWHLSEARKRVRLILKK